MTEHSTAKYSGTTSMADNFEGRNHPLTRDQSVSFRLNFCVRKCQGSETSTAKDTEGGEWSLGYVLEFVLKQKARCPRESDTGGKSLTIPHHPLLTLWERKISKVTAILALTLRQMGKEGLRDERSGSPIMKMMRT